MPPSKKPNHDKDMTPDVLVALSGSTVLQCVEACTRTIFFSVTKAESSIGNDIFPKEINELALIIKKHVDAVGPKYKIQGRTVLDGPKVVLALNTLIQIYAQEATSDKEIEDSNDYSPEDVVSE